MVSVHAFMQPDLRARCSKLHRSEDGQFSAFVYLGDDLVLWSTDVAVLSRIAGAFAEAASMLEAAQQPAIDPVPASMSPEEF